MNSKNSKSLVYSIPEAAQLMGVSTRTMYTLAHKKGFPCIKLTPNRVVISRAGLEEWIQKQVSGEGGDN